MQSRLSRRIEKQTKKSFFLSVFGLIVLCILLVKFGIPLLVNASMLVSGNKQPAEANVQKKNIFIPTPVLDSLPDATNSAKLTISGTAEPQYTINLYINDSVIEKTLADKNGQFVFRNVALKKGENEIKVKAKQKDEESEFSDVYTVIFNSNPPKLSIDSPSDGQSYKKEDKTIQVKGTTDPGVKVTINGFWAIVDAAGNFSYSLPLKDGENVIKCIAEDEAGNKTESERKVTYSP